MDRQTAAVLDERARRLAIPVAEAGREGQTLLAFAVGAARFAVPMPGVTMAREAVRVEPLPGVPPWVAGVAGIRGRIVPAVWVDLFLRSGDVAPARPEGPVHAIVLRSGDVEAALLASAIESVVTVGERELEPLPDGADATVVGCAVGTIGGRLVLEPVRLVDAMVGATTPTGPGFP